MRSYILLGSVLLLFLMACEPKSENVKALLKYNEAYNSLNADELAKYVHDDIEVYYEDAFEVKGKASFMRIYGWAQVMDAHNTLEITGEEGDKVFGVESFTNYRDSVLEMPLQRYKVTYTLEKGQVLRFQMDTLPGHDKDFLIRSDKLAMFYNYADSEGISQKPPMNEKGAKELREYLLPYARATQMER